MNNEIIVVLLSDVIKKRAWLYDVGIPQAISSRLSKAYKVFWHHHEPSSRYPLVEHRRFMPVGLKQEILEAMYSPLRRIRELSKSSWKNKMVQPGEQTILYENSIQRLLAKATESGVEYIALVMDNNTAIFPESVELGLRLARKTKADILHCSQVEGIIPIIVSSAFLTRWIRQEKNINPALLNDPASLKDVANVVDVIFFDDEELDGNFRCSPIDLKEKRLLEYWEEQSALFRDALSHTPEVHGEGRTKLQKMLYQYRADLAAGLEMYHVVGTLYDVNELRQLMMTTSKPLTDYFVVATHYGLFLQKYAGLKNNSHVVDVEAKLTKWLPRPD